MTVYIEGSTNHLRIWGGDGKGLTSGDQIVVCVEDHLEVWVNNGYNWVNSVSGKQAAPDEIRGWYDNDSLVYVYAPRDHNYVFRVFEPLPTYLLAKDGEVREGTQIVIFSIGHLDTWTRYGRDWRHDISDEVATPDEIADWVTTNAVVYFHTPADQNPMLADMSPGRTEHTINFFTDLAAGDYVHSRSADGLKIIRGWQTKEDIDPPHVPNLASLPSVEDVDGAPYPEEIQEDFRATWAPHIIPTDDQTIRVSRRQLESIRDGLACQIRWDNYYSRDLRRSIQDAYDELHDLLDPHNHEEALSFED